MRTLIVDGYNIIHAWPSLKRALNEGGLEHARSRLTHTLSEYAAQSGMEVTVVYDAHGRSGGKQSEVIDGVTVQYGSSSASADHVIERLAYKAARDGGAADVLVATSDRLQRSVVTGMGVPTMSARALEEEVSRVLAGREQTSDRLRSSARSARRVEDSLSEETRRRLEALRRGQRDDGAAPETEGT
jgi:predicted RNA-binding protein with PIN domain